jgi:hypothetical protein
VEIYIHKLNVLEDQALTNYTESELQNFQEEKRLMQEEFYAFLEQNKVIYPIMILYRANHFF